MRLNIIPVHNIVRILCYERIIVDSHRIGPNVLFFSDSLTRCRVTVFYIIQTVCNGLVVVVAGHFDLIGKERLQLDYRRRIRFLIR